jgi:hypothetical protein
MNMDDTPPKPLEELDAKHPERKLALTKAKRFVMIAGVPTAIFRAVEL